MGSLEEGKCRNHSSWLASYSKRCTNCRLNEIDIRSFLSLSPACPSVSGVNYCCTQPDEFHVNRKFQSFYWLLWLCLIPGFTATTGPIGCTWDEASPASWECGQEFGLLYTSKDLFWARIITSQVPRSCGVSSQRCHIQIGSQFPCRQFTISNDITAQFIHCWQRPRRRRMDADSGIQWWKRSFLDVEAGRHDDDQGHG